MKSEQTPLERLVCQIESAGRDWVEAQFKSDQLKDGEKNYLSALMNSYEQTHQPDKVTEAKLERLVRGSADFGAYITGKNTAKAETGKAKVRYEALQNYFEAQRSEKAFERAKVEKGIYYLGK